MAVRIGPLKKVYTASSLAEQTTPVALLLSDVAKVRDREVLKSSNETLKHTSDKPTQKDVYIWTYVYIYIHVTFKSTSIYKYDMYIYI